jgi:hypothetical protein
MRFMASIRKMFQRKDTPVTKTIDFGLAAPGANFKSTSVAAAEVVSQPVVVAPQSIVPKPVIATPRCPNCRQVLQQKSVEPVAEDPNNPDTRKIDWEEEARTDLPMRTSMRIQFLLKHETLQQTQDRILNDGHRYKNARARAGQL